MAKILKIALSFFIASTVVSDDQYCRVLALAGGGDAGSYQAGVIKGLVDTEPTTHWDIITGISVGSLNGAGLSIFDIGQEKEAADFLVNIWKNIKGHKDIYQNYWLGPLYGLLESSGIYDTSPLKDLLTNIVKDKTLKRKFLLGATNIRSGTYDVYDETTLNYGDYVDAIMSSAAYPVLLPSHDFRGNKYMDGGVKNSVDVAGGIHKCLDSGFKDEQIIVDVILCSSEHLSEIDATTAHPLNILNRVFQLYSNDKYVKDIDDVKTVFENVKFRYIIEPTVTLPSGDLPLNFSPDQIQIMIQQGIEDAQNVVKLGTGVSFDNFIKKHKEARYKELRTNPFNKKTIINKEVKVEENNNDSIDFLDA